jgi:hypothetical protein
MNSSQRDDRLGAASSLDTPDPRYYAVEELDVLPTPRGPIRLRQGTPAPGKVRLLARTVFRFLIPMAPSGTTRLHCRRFVTRHSTQL